MPAMVELIILGLVVASRLLLPRGSIHRPAKPPSAWAD
jgi:hypothetical protein